MTNPEDKGNLLKAISKNTGIDLSFNPKLFSW